MPRKTLSSDQQDAREVATPPAAGRGKSVDLGRSTDDLARLTLKACMIARDAAFNLRDLLMNSSRMAFLAIKDSEQELDQIERQIDERMPAAITRVNEGRAGLLPAWSTSVSTER